MSDNTAIEAYFVRVDDNCRLVIDVDGRQVAVPVTDALARGVDEARRRMDESKGTRSSRSLPISTIQMLVRQGVSIADVAKGYGISESQVSRFAQPILVERKMAIEQFLSLPAPRPATGPGVSLPSSSHSIGDLVKARFTVDGTSRASVEWSASRKPRQPWLIMATIHAPHRTLGAQWQWNVAENTVTPLNPTATWILEGSEPTRRAVEAGMSGDDADDDAAGQAGQTPTVSATRAARTPGIPLPPAAARAEGTTLPPIPTKPGGKEGLPAASPEPTPRASGKEARPDAAPGMAMAAAAREEGRQNDVDAVAASGKTATGAPNEDASESDAPQAKPQPQQQQPAAPRRRPKRTAVPSWDEIMFGE